MADQRFTIIVRQLAGSPETDWNGSPQPGEALAFLDSVTAVPSVLDAAEALGLEIARLIIDRAATAEELLVLLARLSPVFRGDVLWIRQDGTAVISAMKRGDGRGLDELTAADVGFYLETFHLVGRACLEKVA